MTTTPQSPTPPEKPPSKPLSNVEDSISKSQLIPITNENQNLASSSKVTIIRIINSIRKEHQHTIKVIVRI